MSAYSKRLTSVAAAITIAAAAVIATPVAASASYLGCDYPRVCFYLHYSDLTAQRPTASFRDAGYWQNLGSRSYPQPRDPRGRQQPSHPAAAGTMERMAVPGKKLKEQIEGALDHHASKRWPDLEEVTITWRGSYGYLRAWTTQTAYIPLARIQYHCGDHYGFALYQASTETYEDTRLPTGAQTATPQEALDCALGLYLNDPTAWQTDPQQD